MYIQGVPEKIAQCCGEVPFLHDTAAMASDSQM